MNIHQTTELAAKTAAAESLTNEEITDNTNTDAGSQSPVIRQHYFINKNLLEKIPTTLRDQDNWVLMRLEWDEEKRKFRKRPKTSIDTRAPAKSNDAKTWGSFELAIDKVSYVNEALSFALNDNGLCVIDIDHCITEDGLTPAAQTVVNMFADTYVERSVSKDGIHIFCYGSTDLSPNTTLVVNGEELDIEIYRDRRFIVMTGEVLPGAKCELHDMQTQLDTMAAWAKRDAPTTLSGASIRKKVLAEHCLDADTLREALNHVSPDVYGDWFRYGIALKRWGEEIGDEETAWTLFDEWSQCTASGNYDQDANAQKWDDWLLDSDNQVTIGSIIHDARQNGWKKDMRSVTSAGNGDRGGRPQQIPHSEAAGSFYGSICEPESGMPVIRNLYGGWWVYDGASGWRETCKEDIASQVVTFMQNDEELSKLASTHYLNSVLLNLGSSNYCGGVDRLGQWLLEDHAEDGDNWMAFANGIAINVMDAAEALKGGTSAVSCMRPKSPAFFSKSYVAYDLVYPESLDAMDHQVGRLAPRFNAYLKQMLPSEDTRRMVRQMAGIALTDSCKFERMYFLTGNGANGKSVFINILTALIGAQNVCNMEPHMFTDRFNSWVLTEHKLNIATDLSLYDGNSSIATIESTLKRVVTGENVTVEKKFQPQYTCRFRARQIFATNHLPTFQDRSNGMKRRTIIVDFPIDLPEEKWDVNLSDKIIANELSGVFLWALGGLADVLENGVYESAEARERKTKHFVACHKERFFIESNCAFDPDSFVQKDVLYDSYKEWSHDGTYKPVGKHNFLEAVRQWGGKSIEEIQKTVDGKRCRIIRGIILHKLDADDVTVEEAREHNAILQPSEEDAKKLRSDEKPHSSLTLRK